MFTGIVRELGRVEALRRGRDDARLAVKLGRKLAARKGDSVCVNGVCLTVVSRSARSLSFDVVFETLARTALGGLEPGDPVNLEPSLTLKDPLGGHLVVGHVDGVGTIVKKDPIGDGSLLRVTAPAEVLSMCVKKGCIAVDGVSLTLTNVGPKSFEIALIPFTLEHTTLGSKGPGDKVNLEIDLLARYAHAFTRGRRPSGLISKDFLRKAGFIQRDTSV